MAAGDWVEVGMIRSEHNSASERYHLCGEVPNTRFAETPSWSVL